MNRNRYVLGAYEYWFFEFTKFVANGMGNISTECNSYVVSPFPVATNLFLVKKYIIKGGNNYGSSCPINNIGTANFDGDIVVNPL